MRVLGTAAGLHNDSGRWTLNMLPGKRDNKTRFDTIYQFEDSASHHILFQFWDVAAPDPTHTRGSGSPHDCVGSKTVTTMVDLRIALVG